MLILSAVAKNRLLFMISTSIQSVLSCCTHEDKKERQISVSHSLYMAYKRNNLWLYRKTAKGCNGDCSANRGRQPNDVDTHLHLLQSFENTSTLISPFLKYSQLYQIGLKCIIFLTNYFYFLLWSLTFLVQPNFM